MAFNPQQIAPIDLNPNLAVGVNLPFSGPSVFTSNYQTKDAIKNNLINFFLTNPGEIPLNPTFGGGLRAFIFSQINENSLDGLKENVELKLETYFPNIIINTLNVLRKDDENTVIIQLNYSIANSNINDNLTLQI
jgi:phage baseplate assembly protein W